MTEISSAVSDSVMRAISSLPQSTQRRPSIRSINSAASRLSARAVAAQEHVLVERVREIGERGGADGVQRRDHTHAGGRHLGGLLGGGALPHAEHPRRLAADGGRQGHGRVDQQLAGRERVLEVGERLGLVAERHADRITVSAARTAPALSWPREGAVRHDRSRALGGFRGAGGIARADRDRHPGAGEAHGQAEPQRARGSDDGDRVDRGGWHGG